LLAKDQDLFILHDMGRCNFKVHILRYLQYIKIFLVSKEIVNICFKLQVQMYLSNFNCDASIVKQHVLFGCLFWVDELAESTFYCVCLAEILKQYILKPQD